MSPFWTHFWVIVGPGLTLIGALLLVWVAMKGLDAQNLTVGDFFRPRLARLLGQGHPEQTLDFAGQSPGGTETGTELTGKYARSAQIAAMIEAVSRMKEPEGTDAFGVAAAAATNQLAAKAKSLEQVKSLMQAQMSATEIRFEAASKQLQEMRAVLFQLADLAGRDKLGVLQRIQEVEARGFWQTFLAAFLIPIGIAFTIVVEVCHLGCR